MLKLLTKFKALIVFGFILFTIIFLYYNKKDVPIDERILLEVTDVVFLDVSVHNKPLGRIEIGLFGDIVPKTVKNFIALSQGFVVVHNGKEEKIGYKGTTIHRIVPNFVIQGGNVTKDGSTENLSLYGGKFPDENFVLKHLTAGWVSMANQGPDTNACQFFITLKPAPWLDGHHVVFGKVLLGMNIVKTIEAMETSNDSPIIPVYISDSGSRDPTDEEVVAFKDIFLI